MADEDTGTLAAVPEEEMRDFDDDPDDAALEGGADDDLADVYLNPGEAVDRATRSRGRWPSWEGAVTCTGSPEPGARALLAWLLEAQPDGRSLGIYSCRNVVGGTATSCHGEGRAVDFGMPMVDGRGCPAGHALVQRLGAQAASLGLQAIIYDRTIWSGRSPDGRPYTGQAPHFDHLHIELTRPAAREMTLSTVRAVLGGAGADPQASGRADAPAPDGDPFPGGLLRRKHSSGEVVCRVQARLRTLGHQIDEVAGCPFGPQTEQAVQTFQRQQGLEADGVVGPRTWQALFAD